jgi:BA14K-like protein
MISMKMLSTAAALVLVAATAAPTASNAEGRRYGGPAGGTYRASGAPAARVAAAPAMRPNGGTVAMRPSGGTAWNGGRTAWNGGGGTWNGGYRHRDGRFWPGAVAAGAVVGGAIAANNAYAYYGGPGYYDAPAYYDDQYADDGAVAVVPAPVGDDSAGYCAQRYRSYDPASGTYLGFDGQRHPCP